MMENEFIPYEQALALKVQGFDEPCLAWYEIGGSGLRPNATKVTLETGHTNSNSAMVSAPLYFQAFRWIRNNKHLHYYVYRYDNAGETYYYYLIGNEWNTTDYKDGFTSYEHAQLECLKHLISYG